MTGKISDLLSGAPAGALDGTEAFEVTDDPTGTPASKGALVSAVRSYILAAMQGMKEPARCARTINMNLATGGLVACDGVTPSAGDRVVVLAQTAPAENGIYIASAGAWSRAPDADTAAKLAAAFLSVREGPTYGGWMVVTSFKATDTLGVSDVLFGSTITELGGYIDGDVFFIYNLPAGDKLIQFDPNAGASAGTWILVPPGSPGTHELVATAEAQTLTNKTVNVNSNTFSGTKGLPFEMVVALGDETTDLTTGTSKVKIRLPRAVTLSKIKGSLSTVGTGGTLIQFDVNKTGVGSLFSTNPTFDASESTTETAATPSVLSTTNLSADDELTFDIDAIGSTTAGKGLKVTLIGVYQ